ncbi:OmpH family outer membrane protein [Geofilum rhodophaeum]|uniref:OmpH family outer membrane protein n=1 Tax=Geofilum rhodophaeum TaxID=1965019 RepID=UPI001F0ACE58|nr:OmpH family outer membrane protein [Geofilum rhodophaeum]
MMQIRIILIAALLGLVFSSAAAQAPKFGHVNVADVVLLMPEYKNISVEMETETTRLEGQLTVMQEELQKLELEFEENFEAYSAEQKEAKQQEYAAMQQRIQEFYAGAQQGLQEKQQALQVPVLEKLRATIQEVGEEQGFLYIFEMNSGLTLFHSEKSEDITPLVKAKLGL